MKKKVIMNLKVSYWSALCLLVAAVFMNDEPMGLENVDFFSIYLTYLILFIILMVAIFAVYTVIDKVL